MVTFKSNSIVKSVRCGFCWIRISQCCGDKILMMCDSLQFNELCKDKYWVKFSTLMCRRFPQRDLFSSKLKNAPLNFSKMTESYVKATKSSKWEQQQRNRKTLNMPHALKMYLYSKTLNTFKPKWETEVLE